MIYFVNAISIHAAREGGDRFLNPSDELLWISIHAAREGGDFIQIYDRLITMISIHAAREGGDINRQDPKINSFSFQSTPPVKAATYLSSASILPLSISIHAAREGGDSVPHRA